MLLRTFFLLLLLASCLRSVSQTNKLVGNWTNGLEIYSSGKINDSLVLFTGGDLHEGGAAFAVRVGRNNKLTITSPQAADTQFGETPSIGKEGDIVVCKTINGTNVLIIESGKGEIQDFLRAAAPKENLEELYIQHKINFELSGRYIDKRSQKEVVFYPNKPLAEGLANSRRYRFEQAYDFPEDVITFGKGASFYYERSKIGLEIYKAKGGEDEEWTKGDKIMSLQWVSSFDLSGKPALKGKFTFASTLFMIRGILRHFSVDSLRLIRNEIFARHGYIFKSEDLKKYFGSQEWYKPQFNDVNGKLTEIEQLNIRLISDYEKNEVVVIQSL